jgi:hypothetical protein
MAGGAILFEDLASEHDAIGCCVLSREQGSEDGGNESGGSNKARHCPILYCGPRFAVIAIPAAADPTVTIVVAVICPELSGIGAPLVHTRHGHVSARGRLRQERTGGDRPENS